MSDREPARPRNQLGEPATKTREETIARLKEKASKNHGGANRERIQAQISQKRRHDGSVMRSKDAQPRVVTC
jgi:hypothetical protein